MKDFEYGLDPQGRSRFFGIYSARVVNINDPLNRSRIQVKVSQATGEEITGWALACLPITSNADHLDHLPHLADEVAALLTTHTSHSVSVSGTSGAASAGTAHTHSFSASQTLTHAAHDGVVAGELTHPHVTSTDPQETDIVDEHTPHRIIPRLHQLVWVMFVAGDPEYPVWMGVQR